MTDDQSETTRPKPQLTPGQIGRWSLPFVISLIVPVLAFALNWEPWFGYAAMIAGALGTLMYVGRSYGIGED